LLEKLYRPTEFVSNVRPHPITAAEPPPNPIQRSVQRLPPPFSLEFIGAEILKHLAELLSDAAYALLSGV